MSDKIGFRVRIWFTAVSGYGEGPERDTVLHNITEIHYQYPKSYGAAPERVAFESDIDGTGYTYDLADIREFEARLPETDGMAHGVAL